MSLPYPWLCRCIRQYARYTCPRCRLRYCSKECYQQHSQQCTESFSRENAVAELRSTAASDEERRRMQEILHRVHESDAGAEMAEALGMDSLDLEGTDASTGGGAGGDGSGSDEDAVCLWRQQGPCLLKQRPLPQRNRPPRCSRPLKWCSGSQVDDAVPLSAATLERLLAAAQGGSGGGGLDAALQQLDARELREFERFVASGQVT
jgi:hypothetical protein